MIHTALYEPSVEAQERNENNFTYHAPAHDQLVRYGSIRAEAKEFADLLLRICPESRELSLALTHLEEASMWANASIARNEPGDPPCYGKVFEVPA